MILLRVYIVAVLTGFAKGRGINSNSPVFVMLIFEMTLWWLHLICSCVLLQLV